MSESHPHAHEQGPVLQRILRQIVIVSAISTLSYARGGGGGGGGGQVKSSKVCLFGCFFCSTENMPIYECDN